jgi:type II secretory pathway component PulF
MLAVGDASDLEVALVNLIKVTEGSKKIIGPLVAALAYPAFLACMAVLMIWAIGSFMVPPMLEAVPPEYRWQGMAKDLVVVSLWIKGNAILAFSILPVIFFLVFMSFSSITGRVRVFLDRIPPWSLYRIFMGVCWLLALSALVKSGSPVSSSMRTLRADANRYLKERIDSTLSYVNNGENLGNALFKTRMEFPDKEIIGDLKVYSELDNFEEALDNLANEWLEDSIVSIEQKASVLNIVAILFICGVVAWSVMAVFEMQNQITSALGL